MIDAWRRWAFDPVDTAPMAVLRMACGLLVLGWTISFLPDAQTFLAGDGTTPDPVDGTSGWWTVPLVAPYAVLAVLAAASVALLVGWHTRLAAVVVALLLIALQRRNVFVLNSGDLLLRELAILVALMPAGERWSLDARGRTPQPRAPWALRLLQLQVSAVYAFSVVGKLGGTTWPDGTAVGMTLQIEDMQRIAVPEALATSVLVSSAMTYGTLVVEAFLIYALWLPRTRWIAIAAGVGLHLGIEATMLIGWFSFTIIACYVAFVPAPVLERAHERIRRRWAARRASGGSSRRATSRGSRSRAPTSSASGS
jgi:hypothetical protein